MWPSLVPLPAGKTGGPGSHISLSFSSHKKELPANSVASFSRPLGFCGSMLHPCHGQAALCWNGRHCRAEGRITPNRSACLMRESGGDCRFCLETEAIARGLACTAGRGIMQEQQWRRGTKVVKAGKSAGGSIHRHYIAFAKLTAPRENEHLFRLFLQESS